MRENLRGLVASCLLACGPSGAAAPAPKAEASVTSAPAQTPAVQEADPKPPAKLPWNSPHKVTVGVEYEITSAGILEGERLLLELKEGAFPKTAPAFADSLEALEASLAESKKRAQELAQGLGAPEPRGAIIRVEPQITWDTLLTLVLAVERVGLSEFHVDAGPADAGVAPIAFTLPTVLRSEGAAKAVEPEGPLLAVEFGEPKAVYAWVPGGEQLELNTTPLEGFAEGLRKTLAEKPANKELIVSARDSMAVGEVLAALEELIGVDCLRGTSVGCSVDRLYFVGANAPGYDPKAQGPLSALVHSTGVWGNPSMDPGFGVQGLGLSGTGDNRDRYGLPNQGVGVIGRGSVFSNSAHGSAGKGSRIRLADPVVKGSLAPEIIRRILRRQFNELRYCYDKARTKDESLAGEVVLRFVIGSAGTVQASQVESATLQDAQMHACMVAANRRWAFPKPEGGIVVVEAGFSFLPSPK